MAFKPTSEVINDFVVMLQGRTEFADVKGWYKSEQSIAHIPAHPSIFVLCSRYNIDQWISAEYIDQQYTMTIGAIVLDQNTETIRNKLYDLIDNILLALFEEETNAAWEYTYLKQRGNIRANFGPIFTSPTEQFMGDAQLEVPVQRKVII